MNNDIDGKGVNRRTFLKGAAASLGAIGLTALTSVEAKTINLHQVPRWDYTAGVVVVGYGAAGGSAAIAAHDAGADVIILEKMSIPGGNSAVCYGGMVIPESVPAAVEYYRRLSFGTVDDDMLLGFAEAMVGVPVLLKKLGAHINIGKRPPAFPAIFHSDIPAFRFAPTGKEGFRFLSEIVKKRGIKVIVKTSAKCLFRFPKRVKWLALKRKVVERKFISRPIEGLSSPVEATKITLRCLHTIIIRG